MCKVVNGITCCMLIAFLLFPQLLYADEKNQDWIYVTKSGDNLWNITTKYLTSIKYWRPMQRLNNITQPRNIPPGTHIRIPVKWSRVHLSRVTVKAVSGSVRLIRSGSGKESSLQEGTILSQGDRVVTPDRASALLEFVDATTLLLVSNSNLVFNTLNAYGDGDVADSHISLSEGRIENKANPKKIPGTRFKITTPSAVMAIRGTNFRVNTEESASRIEVTGGSVNVLNDKNSVDLKGGFGLLAQKGLPLKKPIQLLPAPDLNALPAVVETSVLKINIPVIKGATAFRVQIARSKALGVLLFEKEYKVGQVIPDFSTLQDGRYVMRVRASDVKSIEGLVSTADFTLNLRPLPPASIYPSADSQIVEKTPDFRWTRPEDATSYHFQLYSAQPGSPVFLEADSIQSEHYKASRSLSPGEYRWRIQSNDKDGHPGPYGHFQSFRLLPEAPVTGDPLLTGKDLTLQWHSAESDQQYHFQLSRQADFSSLLVDKKINSPRYILTNPKDGDYFMRVSVIDNEGFQGPYSPVQSFNVPETDVKWVKYVILLATILLAL